jgi:hypothetical protein
LFYFLHHDVLLYPSVVGSNFICNSVKIWATMPS